MAVIALFLCNNFPTNWQHLETLLSSSRHTLYRRIILLIKLFRVEFPTLHHFHASRYFSSCNSGLMSVSMSKEKRKRKLRSLGKYRKLLWWKCKTWEPRIYDTIPTNWSTFLPPLFPILRKVLVIVLIWDFEISLEISVLDQ